jgi:4-aminobutyrate aminotransferase-like enzyme
MGRPDIMDLYEPGSMTSTHSGSPIPVAAAIANIRILRRERLVERAAALEPVLRDGLLSIQKKDPKRLGSVRGRGLVAGIQIVKAGTKEPDGALALAINEACFRKGLLMFAPVGPGNACVKISPPLSIPEDALCEGIAVLGEAVDEVLAR